MTLLHHIPVEASNAKRDHLWSQISSLPYFRGMLRAVESRFYENIDLPSPTLDLGCGDGHFATLTFERLIEVGLDPWDEPLKLAAQTNTYTEVIKSEGSTSPFQEHYFGSAISNSVLEHIPDLDPVLAELARVLKPGSPFIFCVPNHQFLSQLSISNFFDRIGLKYLARAYRKFFNRISRHHHCDHPEIWHARLEKAGFEIVDWWHYFSPSSLRILEWGHYFGLPSLIAKRIFQRWILVPRNWNLFLVDQLTRKSYEEASIQPMGAYTFFITKRK
jgi:SAM-dependent methyltransferase